MGSPPKYPNRLRDLRLQRGWEQSDVAERLGIHETTVSRHENGNRSLDPFTMEKYARLYNVTPYELFVPLPKDTTEKDA